MIERLSSCEVVRRLRWITHRGPVIDMTPEPADLELHARGFIITRGRATFVNWPRARGVLVLHALRGESC